VFNVLKKFITESSNYVENVNLFTVSMGEYATEAQRYAETVGEAMGIDPGEWMRNQGVFMTLATGFGVASDRAATMSKNLTQLGYDISSFYNLNMEEAMKKLQSGLAGELEPLRRIGYDLSQAKLAATALSLGIEKTVSSMTQAEKAELRYYAIMTQVTTSHGDMARTLNAPANQLRIFKSQLTMAAREIGNVFIPMLNNILPTAIAVVKVIRILSSHIASLLGFEMPEIDYSGVDSMGGLNEELEEGAENAKKLKNYMMGFDELNVIDPTSGVDDEDLSSSFDFELPEYDFMEGLIDSKVNAIVEKMKEWLGITGEIDSWADLLETRFGNILELVKSIGTLIITWKVASWINSLSTGIGKLKGDIQKSGLTKILVGITIAVTGFELEKAGAYELGLNGLDLDSLLKTAIGSALGIAGSLLVFGTGPLGWTVGIGLALVALISGFEMGKSDKLRADDMAKRFGDYVMSNEEIQDFVKKLTKTPLSVTLGLIVDEIDTRTGLKTQVEDAIKEINRLNFKVQCGIEVTQEGYYESIDTLVSKATEYLKQDKNVALMSIDVAFKESETGTRLTEFANSFYTSTETELNILGARLKECVSTGFVDGVWIEDKEAEALALQKEIQEILDYIANVEFEAKLQSIKLDTLGTELSEDSFKKVMEEAQAAVKGGIEDLEAVRFEALKIAKIEYDQNVKTLGKEAALQIYNDAIAEAEKVFQEGKVELNLGTYEFGTDVLTSAYSEEIARVIPLLQSDTQTLFMQGTTLALPEDTYTNISLLMGQLETAYLDGFSNLGLSKEARTNLRELLKTMTPTIEDYEKIAKEALATGQAVPENVAKGLGDIKLLEAMSGKLEAGAYLIGQHLSTDQSFLDMLATCEKAGESINQYTAEGLVNNLQVVEDAANGTITLMNDTIGEKVLEVTPTLVDNLEALGINLSDGLLEGVSGSVVKEDYDNVWSRIGNWFLSLFGIHSPSTVFAEYGGYIAQGLNDGVDGGVVESDYDTIFKRISDALTGVKNVIKGIINGILSFIESLANGVIKGINTVIGALNKFHVDVPGWVTTLTGLTEFGFNIPTLSTISIPRLADGGMVDAGQLFIAREAGAEMVGSIGRRTAVANNDQIVAGIANGVAEANGEQNALIREQNNLLRALLEKESGVYLDGRSLTNSVEKYQRERGRVMVTGGVV
jgi:phage-related protein